jgi:hypothetical protein
LGLGPRLGIECFKLARPPRHPQKDARFVFAAQLVGVQPERADQTGGDEAGSGPKEAATIHPNLNTQIHDADPLGATFSP